MTRRSPESSSVRRAISASASALMLLTTAHHLYGAVIYGTPWRNHVAIPGVLTIVVIGGALVAFRRDPESRRGRIALWAAVGVITVVPIAGIGLFEGGYNHLLKDALYFGGASPETMRRLFPPPAYELPNDLFFEVTGVLQLALGIVTGHYVYRLLRESRKPTQGRFARPAGSTSEAEA